jgi:hypothetical protein
VWLAVLRPGLEVHRHLEPQYVHAHRHWYGGGIPVQLRRCHISRPHSGEFSASRNGGSLLRVGGCDRHVSPARTSAGPAEEILKSDPRPPVVYLRSFRDDSATALVPNSSVSTLFSVTRTEEQQIAEVFGELGPFIAIGRPGESLPELGAARMHVANEQWQETVADLMKRARLVLYRASDTQGFKWEVQRGGELLGPTRMAFLIPSHGSLLLLDPE